MILTILPSWEGAGASMISCNLAVALSQLGEKTLLVDGNLEAPRVHDILGVIPTLDDFGETLDGENNVEEAIIDGAYPNLSILSGKMEFRDKDEDLFKFSDLIRDLGKDYATVLVDGPGRTEEEWATGLRPADAAVLVSTTASHTIMTALKIKRVAQGMNRGLRGIIVNKALTGMSWMADEIEAYMGIPALAILPLDEKVGECLLKGKPIVVKYPESIVSQELVKIARKLLEN
ncbi:MAG: MinD/ParA family protein [Candidatus Hydrothermarchaeales archaeon]